MKEIEFTLAAGQATEVHATGDFFRVQSAPEKLIVSDEAGNVRLEMRQGNAARVNRFKTLRVENPEAGAQTVRLMVGFGAFEDQRISGVVSISQGAAITDGAPITVGTTAVQIAAASATRRGLRVRNSGTEPVSLGSAGVSQGGAVYLEPGAIWIERDAAAADWYARADAPGGEIVAQGVF